MSLERLISRRTALRGLIGLGLTLAGCKTRAEILATPPPERPSPQSTKEPPRKPLTTEVLSSPTIEPTLASTPSSTEVPCSPTPAKILKTPTLTSLPEVEPEKKENLFQKIVFAALQQNAEERRKEKRKDPEFSKRIEEELNRERINFLFLGASKEGDFLLTDSIQLLSLNLQRNNFDIISLHRDTEAPEISHFLKTDQPYRINAALGIGGFPLTEKIMENATGLVVDFVVAMKMEVLKNAVDEIFDRQLEIILPREIDDENMGYFPKGKQTLNGKEVLRVARARYYGSNYDRNLIQQLLIETMIVRFNEELRKGPASAGKTILKSLKFFENETREKKIITNFDKTILLDLGRELLRVIREEPTSLFKDRYQLDLPHLNSAVAFALETGTLESASDLDDPYRLKALKGDIEAVDLPERYWFILREKTQELLSSK